MRRKYIDDGEDEMEEDEKKSPLEDGPERQFILHHEDSGTKGQKRRTRSEATLFLNGWVAQVRLEGEREKAGL